MYISITQGLLCKLSCETCQKYFFDKTQGVCICSHSKICHFEFKSIPDNFD